MSVQTEGVRLVVEGQNQFIGAMDKAQGSVNGLNTKTVNLAAGMAVATQALGFARQAFSVIKGVIDDTVGAYIDYANAMQDGSRLTGIQIEEYSRLVQVADDVRISQDQLKTAFQIASRQGIDVSIEGIQKIAEEYNGMTDPVKKAQLLLKDFGRGGADMGRLMELGADGIRDATSAVSANLIVTEESARIAEEARLSVDEFNDSWTGVKNNFSVKVLPAINKLLDGLIAVSDQVGRVENALKDHNEELIDSAMSFDDYSTEMIRAEKVAGKLTTQQGYMIQALEGGTLTTEQYNSTIDALMLSMGYLTDEQLKLHRSQIGLNEMAAEGITNFGDLTATLPGTTAAIGDMTDEMDVAAEKTWDASDAFKELTTQQIFNVASAGLDQDAQMALAEQMGLLDEKAIAQYTTLDTLRSMYDDGTLSLGAYNTMVANLDASIEALESKSIDIDVHWNYTSSGTAGIGGTVDYMEIEAGLYANGGDPPANRPSLVGERGIELFMPGMQGKIISNADIMGALAQATLSPSLAPASYQSSYSNTVNNNFNLNLSTMNSPQVVQNSFAMMRMLAG